LLFKDVLRVILPQIRLVRVARVEKAVAVEVVVVQAPASR
jgi:hypothetical protein